MAVRIQTVRTVGHPHQQNHPALNSSVDCACPRVVVGRMLYTMIPFFRNDGYWVISDLFGVPNLLYNANKTLLDTIKSFPKLGFKSLRSLSQKEHHLLIYAALNALYIPLFICYIAWSYTETLIAFPYTVWIMMISFITSGTLQVNLTKEYLIVSIFYFLLALKAQRLIRKVFLPKSST